MDETARKFEEAMAWLREQEALTDDVRAQFAEMLPWLPKSAQDGLWKLTRSPSVPASFAAPISGFDHVA